MVVMWQQLLPSLMQVLKAFESGYCQPPPPGCPRNMYKLMVDCWWVQQWLASQNLALKPLGYSTIHNSQLIWQWRCDVFKLPEHMGDLQMYTVHTIHFQCWRCTLPQQLGMYTLTQSHSVHHSLMIIYNKLQLLACPCTNSFITCVYIQLLSTHTYCMYIYTYILQIFFAPIPCL